MLKTIAYFLFECIPMVAFFVVGHWYNFAVATAVNVTLAALIFAYFYFTSKYTSLITIVFAFNVIIAGILSLLFNSPDIFIFSDTIYYATCAILLAWSLRWKKTFLEHLVGHTFALTAAGWRRLTYHWIIVNIICAITNDYVRIFATPEYWIDFQFWRGVAVFAFALSQFYVSHKYRIPEEAGPWGIRKQPLASKQV
jgi:intracellular septation protein A